ncbi:MAG: sterol desaturase family protein [Sphingobacteriaceae bacterium]|nr:sterol desaturase family protein [Sphingobacteriaceae bacterium]
MMIVFWFLVGFVGIEVFATLIHKYLMHGPLWFIHESHHRPKGKFELNDLFAVLFAGIGIALLLAGSIGDFDYRFWIGLGISVYGGVYFYLHDVLVHRRTFAAKTPEIPYIKALRHAHRMHHKHVNKQPSESFGLLFFNWRYFSAVKKAR